MRSFALALLLLVSPAAQATAPEARVQKEEGDRLRQAGDVDGATRAYQAALKLDGGYAEAHEALGEVHYASRQTERAIESFGHAVEIDPAYALAWYNLAFAARKIGDQQKALVAYEQYVKLRPTDADGHYGLAETHRALGHREAAVAQYQLFIDLAQVNPAQAAWVEKARAAQAELRPAAAAAPAATAPVAAGVLAAPVVAVAAPLPAAASNPAPAAAPLPGAPAPAMAPSAVSVPAPSAPVTPGAVSPVSLAPVSVAPAPATPAPAAVGPLAPGPAAPVAAPAPATPLPAVPTRALIEKMGTGDRAFLAGDHRSALFAYQDAVYLDPTSAVARIRLARAYAALGRKDQATQQVKQALELEPGNAEARKLAEELANPAPLAPRPSPPVGAAPATRGPAGAAAPKVYRLTDEAGAPPPAAAPVPAPSVAPAPTPPVAAAAPDQAGASRHYRKALDLISDRDFAGALVELDQAVRANPLLGAAFSARAAAYHGLGRYQEAVRDYQAALRLAPELATPLYGLAESYRQLQDPRAGELFARYAESGASDVRSDLRETARLRAVELGAR